MLAVPSAYLALKICGGLYLLWLAFKIIKHAKEPIEAGDDSQTQMSLRRAYMTGLITQLSNPKLPLYWPVFLLRAFAKRNSNLLLLCIAGFMFLY